MNGQQKVLYVGVQNLYSTVKAVVASGETSDIKLYLIITKAVVDSILEDFDAR